MRREGLWWKVVIAVLVVAIICLIFWLPRQTVEVIREAVPEDVEAELEQLRAVSANRTAELEQCLAQREECLAELEKCSASPQIEVEKWVKKTDACCWQKEISANKSDWVKFRVLVKVTGAIKNVRVKDPALKGNPWIRIRNLAVDGISFSGNIISGISLGDLTNEHREITFEALLCSAAGQYRCGENVLANEVEATGDCGYSAAASAEIKVYITCPPSPSSCCPPSPPEPPPPPCPPPEPPPPPPKPDPDPCPDPEPPPTPPEPPPDNDGPAPRPP